MKVDTINYIKTHVFKLLLLLIICTSDGRKDLYLILLSAGLYATFLYVYKIQTTLNVLILCNLAFTFFFFLMIFFKEHPKFKAMAVLLGRKNILSLITSHFLSD